MAADLHIHVVTSEMTEEDLRCFFSSTLGSKYGPSVEQLTTREGGYRCPDGGGPDCPHHKRVSDSPNVWVGEVSWLKAAIFKGGEETYIPGPIRKVSELIDDGVTVIDGAFIEGVRKALLAENTTSYQIAEEGPVIAFLELHRGQRVFGISW